MTDTEKKSCCSSKQSCSSKQPEQAPAAKGTKVHRKMTIEDILKMFPQKAQRLQQEITNAGLHCVGCHAATYETLEVGMMSHGFQNEAIDRLVDRLNSLLEEENDITTITLTARAAAKYQQILQDEGKHGWGMRFEERMAGCNGFEYALDYSEKADKDDDIFECFGVQIHVKKAMLSRLLGSTIDFIDGVRGSGFKISNPNVKSSCGCGTSHNY